METGNVVFFAPASVARLYPRPGIAFRPVSDLPDATLVLAWPPGRALAGRRRLVRAACTVAAAAQSRAEPIMENAAI